jgi:energy-coupling factor transporter ATP-binding protein EcfA2
MSTGNSNPQKVTYIGRVDYRNKQLTFGIKEKDRTRHTYIIGKTGMGKSTLLENLAIQDINNGEGLCVIDPHGSMAEKLLDFIPEHRVKDVIYFAPFDSDYPVGLNVLEQVDASKRHLVANGLMAAFKKVFGEERFSDRIQYILNNIILALLENEGQSLLGVNRMLSDKEYRKFIVSNVKDPSVKSFWEEEFAKAGDKYQQEAAPGIQNKIGQFVSNPLIRNIIGQHKTSFNIREVMDKQKILIVNLSKGKVGEGNADLIGSLLITKIYLAAMSRADAGASNLEKLPPFYFYVDEFQNFANESFASILSESRKYNLALTVAHQYVEQMEDEVKAAVFGNVGTMIAFRVGATDAEIFEKEFAPYFVLDDIVNLSAYQIYLRLMIDGAGSKPFSAHTLDPISPPPKSFAEMVITMSRHTYGRPLTEVEEEVTDFYKPRLSQIAVKLPETIREKQVPVSSSPKTYYKEEKKTEIPKKVEQSISETLSEKIYSSEYKTIPERYTDDKKRDISPKESKSVKEDSSRKNSVPKVFDDRPAMSLKDALARALQDKKQEVKVIDTLHHTQEKKIDDIKKDVNKIEESIKHAARRNEERPIKTKLQVAKEIPEDVLKKLIEE